MSYWTECDGCGTGGVVPASDEQLTSGTRLHKVPTDEYEKAGYRSQFAETEEEHAKAEERMKYVSEYNHYCSACLNGENSENGEGSC